MKFNFKFKSKKASIIAVVFCVALITTVAVGSTVAWLTAVSDQKINTFDPANVTCEVKEEFPNDGTGEVKNNVQIQNTSNIPAYIRVALVPAWKDGNGADANIVNIPATLEDCNIGWGDSFDDDWIEGEDGFYYARAPINPLNDSNGDKTPVLIKSCVVNNNPETDDLYFELQVIASAIQANPPKAVVDSWGVKIENGEITSAGGAK